MKFAIFLKSSPLFSCFYCLFLFINKALRLNNKTLQLNNLKTRTAMNPKISVFVICVEAIIYLVSYKLHDFTFNKEFPQSQTYTKILFIYWVCIV